MFGPGKTFQPSQIFQDKATPLCRHLTNSLSTHLISPILSSKIILLDIISGLLYKPMIIINDDSRVIKKLETLITDDARVVIYNRHMFIGQATGVTVVKLTSNRL